MPTLFLSLNLLIFSGLLTNKSFASMDLKSLIVEGLQHNINIKNQRIGLEKAKIDLSNSKKAYLPTVSLSSGLSYSHSAGEGTVSKTASLSTAWTLWDHWQTQTTIENTGLSLKNEEISTFKTVQDYILKVLGSYLSLQLLKNEKVITQQGRDSAEMNYKKAFQLVKLGVKTKIDLYSPEISLLNANRDLLEINKNIKTALTTFQFLINPSKKVEVSPVNFLTFKPYFQETFEKNWESFQKNWEKVLLKNNSEIKIELNNMEKSKNSLRQEKLNMWPQITASASHTWDLAEQFKSGDTNPQSYQAGLNLTWTVFDWGKSRANLKSSIYNLETSELNFKKQTFEKKNTILRLFQDYKILAESIKSSQLILKKAKAQQTYSKNMYNLGKITSSDLRQARTDLFSARVGLARRLKDKFLLMGQILQAFGQDLRP